MPEYCWSKELSVDNPHLDRQHQQMIAMVNSLPDHQAPDFSTLFAEMLRYTTQHFSEEEAWMRKNDYPLSFEHLKLHQQLSDQFDTFLRQFVSNQLDREQFRQFLYTWLRDHILEHDLAFARFLREKTA